MNIKKDKLKEVVVFLTKESNELAESLTILLNLAEQYLSLEGKMPQKIPLDDYGCCCNSNDSGFAQCDNCRRKEDNELIDKCTLAFIGLLNRMKKEEKPYYAQQLIDGEPYTICINMEKVHNACLDEILGRIGK